MRLRTLAGALALGLGASALLPHAVQAQDRGRDRGRGGHVQAVQGSRNDRSRDHDRFRDYRRSYRDGRSDWSYRSYSYGRPYRSFSYSRPSSYSRPYRYRSYSYAYPYYRSYGYDGYYGGYSDGYYDNGYYGDYCDDGYYSSSRYRRAPLVVYPSFRYYRPALGIRVGGPRFGVWLGF